MSPFREYLLALWVATVRGGVIITRPVKTFETVSVIKD
jgi:hypothetical protein